MRTSLLIIAVLLLSILLISSSAFAEVMKEKGTEGVFCQERGDQPLPPPPPQPKHPGKDNKPEGPPPMERQKKHGDGKRPFPPPRLDGPKEDFSPQEMEEFKIKRQRILARIEELRQAAQNAKAQGRLAEAEQLWKEAEDLVELLKKDFPVKEGWKNLQREEEIREREELEKLERKRAVLLDHLKEVEYAAMEAEKKGDTEGAEQIRREAEEIKSLLRKDFPPGLEPIPAKEKEKIETFIKDFEPRLFARLSRLRDENPGLYFKLLKEAQQKMRNMNNLKEKNPEKYKEILHMKELEREIFKLVEKYRSSSEDDKNKEEILVNLKNHLSELFNIRQQEHEREIKRLEKELAKLKDIYNKHEENRDAIVEKRLKQIIGEDNEFDW
ncbi:MAG: hypothetical protein ABIH42_02930 [Planctomycetota bacterium]